jgi:Arc/MetJ-type ribon-helix-helix transcriptional regulator
MNISLSPELQKRIAEKVERGDVGTADALVEQALNFYLDYEGSELDEEDFRDANAAIGEALKQAKRGEGRPAEEVFADLRARHGISR